MIDITIKSAIPAFKRAWQDILKTSPPDDSQWAIWSRLHSEDILKEGLLRLCVKFKQLGGRMDDDYKIRFMSSACNKLTRERNAALDALRALRVQTSAPSWETVPDEAEDARWNR